MILLATKVCDMIAGYKVSWTITVLGTPLLPLVVGDVGRDWNADNKIAYLVLY